MGMLLAKSVKTLIGIPRTNSKFRTYPFLLHIWLLAVQKLLLSMGRLLKTLLNNPTQVNLTGLNNQCVNTDQWSSEDFDESVPNNLSDTDSWSEDEIAENTSPSSDREKTLLTLTSMGYTVEDASIAMDRCGKNE